MKIFKRKRFTAEEVIKKCGFRIILVFFQFSFFIFGEMSYLMLRKGKKDLYTKITFEEGLCTY